MATDKEMKKWMDSQYYKEIQLLEYFDDDVCELMNKYIKKGFISEKGKLFFDDDDIVDDFNYHLEGLKNLIRKTK